MDANVAAIINGLRGKDTLWNQRGEKNGIREKWCNLSNMFLCVLGKKQVENMSRNSNSIRSSEEKYIVIYFPLENLIRKSTFMRVFNHSELTLTQFDWHMRIYGK